MFPAASTGIATLISALVLVLPCASLPVRAGAISETADQAAAHHLISQQSIISETIVLEAVSISAHARSLLHGCHYRRCMPVCNRCKFRNSRARIGHCKKNGFVFRCTRPRPAAPPQLQKPAPQPPPREPPGPGEPPAPPSPPPLRPPSVPATPPVPYDYAYGGAGDDGDEGDEGEEGDEGNEGATEYDYENAGGEEYDVGSFHVDDDVSYSYDELVEVPPEEAPPMIVPPKVTPPKDGISEMEPSSVKPPKARPPQVRPPKKRTPKIRPPTSRSRTVRPPKSKQSKRNDGNEGDEGKMGSKGRNRTPGRTRTKK